MNTENLVLRAALLWARNHLDLTNDPVVKARVVARLDRVLENYQPSITGATVFARYIRTR